MKRKAVLIAVAVLVIGFIASGIPIERAIHAAKFRDTAPIMLVNIRATDFIGEQVSGPTGTPITKIGTYQIHADVAEDTNFARFKIPFDAASTECVYGTERMPFGYGGGAVHVCHPWLSAGQTTGNVVWTFSYRSHADGELADGTATATSTWTEAVKGVVETVTDQCPVVSSFPAGGRSVDWKFCRTGGASGDTMSGDALLLGLSIETAE